MRRFMLVLLLAGCGHRASSGPPDMAFVPAFAAHDKVDILFMIDNSLSTSPYQQQLQARFPQLIKSLDDAARAGHPASYHIGVVTSDLGAGLNTQNCKPGGDGAKLWIGPENTSYPPPADCASFALSNGVRFLEYDQAAGSNNIEGGLSVPDAFTCMSSVGDMGCGFQHQLESTYRALHDNIPENAGFLRDDALLVVVYLTDEDDCSAPDDTDLFVNTPDATAQYGALHSFRCTQWGISCTTPPAPLDVSSSGGPFDDCQPLDTTDGGKLYDVQRYIDFFTKPGGAKPDPSDVILAAIAAPPAPFGWTITMPCFDQANTPQCPALNNSCLSPADPSFFGDPAVRLAAVINAGVTSQFSSLCDTDYSGALAGVAQKIIARLK